MTTNVPEGANDGRIKPTDAQRQRDRRARRAKSASAGVGVTSTSSVRKFRQRKREGVLLLPRIEIDGTIADDLCDAGLLQEWDSENPQAVAEAVVRLLNLLRRNAIS